MPYKLKIANSTICHSNRLNEITVIISNVLQITELSWLYVRHDDWLMELSSPAHRLEWALSGTDVHLVVCPFVCHHLYIWIDEPVVGQWCIAVSVGNLAVHSVASGYFAGLSGCVTVSPESTAIAYHGGGLSSRPIGVIHFIHYVFRINRENCKSYLVGVIVLKHQHIFWSSIFLIRNLSNAYSNQRLSHCIVIQTKHGLLHSLTHSSCYWSYSIQK